MISVIADIGGTNIRLAVCDLKTGQLSNVKVFKCSNFLTIDDALFEYFSTLKSQVVDLCIAIACPVDSDHVSMTNLNWQFSKKALKEKFQLSSLYVINDYTAISLAVPYIESEHKRQIGGGCAKPNEAIAVLGAGTGLGVSHLIKSNNKWCSIDGEGGHVSFAPTTKSQADILLLLQEQYEGHVSAERVLSGHGLVNIYNCLCRIEGKKPKYFEPKEITDAAINGTCPLSVQSLTVFCEILGAFAGNLALNLACNGGVYIAGGIVPRFQDFFESSDFRKFFESKGRFKEYVSKIPTFLITHENPGLLGAGVFLRQEYCMLQ